MVKINQFGTYVNAKGLQKSAVVIGTTDTLVEGTSIPALADANHAHILVFSLSGKVAPRYNVVVEGNAKAGFVFRPDVPADVAPEDVAF